MSEEKDCSVKMEEDLEVDGQSTSASGTEKQAVVEINQNKRNGPVAEGDEVLPGTSGAVAGPSPSGSSVEIKKPGINMHKRNYRSANASAADDDEDSPEREDESAGASAPVRAESELEIPHADNSNENSSHSRDAGDGEDALGENDNHLEESDDQFAARLRAAMFPGGMEIEGDDDDEESTDSSSSGLRYMEDDDDLDDDSSDSSDSSLTDLEERLERRGSVNGIVEETSNSAAITAKKRKLESSSKRKAEVPPVILKPKPKSKWNGPRDLFQRELGYKSKSQAQCAQIFRSKFYGSLFSAERLELMHQMEGHEGCVNCLNFNYSGTKLASGSDDMQIKIWNYGVGKLITSFNSQHRANVFQAKFLPLIGLDNMIVSCARDCTVKLTELNPSGTVGSTRKLVNHRGPVHKLSVSLDNPQIVLSCGEDGAIFSSDIREEKPQLLTVLKDRDKRIPLYSISGNPLNFHEFCVSGRDQYIRVYDTRALSHISVPVSQDGDGDTAASASSSHQPEPSGRSKKLQPVKKFCPHHLQTPRDQCRGVAGLHVTAATYNYNGKEIIGSYNDENIYLFDATHSDGADYIKCFEGHRNSITVKGVNFFGDRSQFIVSGSDCGHIYLWDKETESIVNFLRGDMGGVVNVLEPHPTVPILATSGLDHDVKIWIPSGENSPKMGGLIPTVRKNLRKRKEEAETSEPLDSQAVQFILNHITRSRLRRGVDSDSDAPAGDSSSGSDDDVDDGRGMECVIS